MHEYGIDLQKSDMAEPVIVSLEECAPHLRTINLFPCRSGFDTGERVLYNPYLLYVHSGRGVFRIGECRYEAEPGDLYYCPAGTVQQIQADTKDPFLLTGIDFDLTSHHRERSLPHPSAPEAFRPGEIPLPAYLLESPGLPEFLRCPGDEELRELLLTMLAQHDRRALHWEAQVGGLLKAVLACMLRLRMLPREARAGTNGLSAVVRHLAANHGAGVTCASIAAEFHYHPDHLSRLMRLYAGMTLKQYLTGLRIREALSMLRYSDLPLAEISERTGFCSQAHFSNAFREKMGHSPSSYRGNAGG